MIRALCAGLGFIGVEIARTVLAHPDLELAAAVDNAPGLAGMPLAYLIKSDDASGKLAISPDLHSALVDTEPDVVLLSTSSRVAAVAPQVLVALDSSCSVITTCEELSCPWGRPETDGIVRAARDAGRAVLATGVNPGFVMDLVPALLSLPCRRVDSILVERVVDLRRRRDALRAKAGVGMAVGEFLRLVDADEIGHVGLDRSARLLAHALGGNDRQLPHVSIVPLADEAGTVYGFAQSTGYPATNGVPAIDLRLTMSMRAKREGDCFRISGEPGLSAEIEGGIFGDSATAALVVNAIPTVLAAPPGLHTVLDLPALHGWRPVAC